MTEFKDGLRKGIVDDSGNGKIINEKGVTTNMVICFNKEKALEFLKENGFKIEEDKKEDIIEVIEVVEEIKEEIKDENIEKKELTIEYPNQINHITREDYTGTNIEKLLLSKLNNKFSSNEWLTFIQAKENGLIIKKGSKSTQLARVIKNTYKDEAGNEKDKKGVKHYNVFNIDQTEPKGDDEVAGE